MVMAGVKTEAHIGLAVNVGQQWPAMLALELQKLRSATTPLFTVLLPGFVGAAESSTPRLHLRA